MRILIVSALFPPPVGGGAELSAYNLAHWLVRNGHDVGVFTTARTDADVVSGEIVDGVKIWRVRMPRPYSAFDVAAAPKWQKPIWHAQDLLDPRNTRMLGAVIDAFQPDVANVHFIQGIGYNALSALADRDIPTVFTLHDLGLACIKMAMFVDGRECAGQCRLCALTGRVKRHQLQRFARIGFVSPSRANLEKLSTLQPLANYPRAHILNTNRYPAPTRSWEPAATVRFLYVGRLDAPKGIDVLLEAITPLAARHAFTLDILGSGPDEAALRERHGDLPWLRFAGHVTVQAVQDAMATSDALFVPSIWLENSPGVIIQALGLSLPVIGSNKGGIPELVRDGENGLLVAPGDVAAWRAAIEGVLAAPDRLAAFRANAAARQGEFDQDALGRKTVAFFERIIAEPVAARGMA